LLEEFLLNDTHLTASECAERPNNKWGNDYGHNIKPCTVDNKIYGYDWNCDPFQVHKIQTSSNDAERRNVIAYRNPENIKHDYYCDNPGWININVKDWE
jgi:hypothetical protein